MFKDSDVVRLKRAIVDVVDSMGTKVSIPAGATGTVVMVYDASVGCEPMDPLWYEIEFTDMEGHTLAFLELSEVDLELDYAYEEQLAAQKLRDSIAKNNEADGM